MNQTESVAFWIGLVGTIAGIVLSIIAIVFSILVDRRSSTVSDKTIQSLQKIESAVERSSSDTRELIKAGWDRMLGNVGVQSPQTAAASDNAKEIAGGIAAELRDELSKLASNVGASEGTSKAKFEEIESYLKNLEATLSAQLRAARVDVRPGAKIDEVINSVRNLSPTAYAILKAIERKHLSRAQYQKLTEGPLGSAILELRQAGLLAPAVHKTSSGPEPCYYYPSEIASAVRAVIEISGSPHSSAERQVRTELSRVGYRSERRSLDDVG
jgi:hypothetical protein